MGYYRYSTEKMLKDTEKHPWILRSGKFSGRMHGVGWRADVESGDAYSAGGDRSDRRSTTRIRPGDKGLHWDIVLSRHQPYLGAVFGIGGISLVGIDFDNRTFIEHWQVTWFMLGSEVWVNRMGVVSGNKL